MNSIEYYNNLSLFELRIVGRAKGVKSPTSLKKQELIDNIIKIETNTIKPQFSKRGRPFKQTISLNSDSQEIKNQITLVKQLLKSVSGIINNF